MKILIIVVTILAMLFMVSCAATSVKNVGTDKAAVEETVEPDIDDHNAKNELERSVTKDEVKDVAHNTIELILIFLFCW